MVASDSAWVFLDWSKLKGDDHERMLSSTELSRRLSEFLTGPPDARPEYALSFGRYMETLRKYRGWSRSLFAMAAGLDPVAIAFLEMGRLTEAELTPFVVKALADALIIPVEELAIRP